MNGVVHLFADRAAFIYRLANHVHDAAKRFGANRDGDRGARVDHFLTAAKTVRGVHRDGTHRVLTEVKRNFDDQVVFALVDR